MTKIVSVKISSFCMYLVPKYGVGRGAFVRENMILYFSVLFPIYICNKCVGCVSSSRFPTFVLFRCERSTVVTYATMIGFLTAYRISMVGHMDPIHNSLLGLAAPMG